MLGEKIADLLKQRGMKQVELAQIVGIPKTTLNSIITRNNTNIDFSVMERIADALGVPIEYFKSNVPTGTKIEPITYDELSEIEERFVQGFTALTPSNRRILIGIAKVLLKEQEERSGSPS